MSWLSQQGCSCDLLLLICRASVLSLAINSKPQQSLVLSPADVFVTDSLIEHAPQHNSLLSSTLNGYWFDKSHIEQ